MMETAAKPNPLIPERWVVFLIICSVYFFVYFHRVSTSVIVKDLLDTFQTNATALGFMSSMYFYLYAFEQPLVGYLSDRMGPRRVIGYSTLAAAAGCFLFAAAPTIGWATAGRGLIGIGVGGVYVPALKALSVWFQKNEFAGMLGLLMSVGNLGAVIATTPLAWAANTWGFRSSFVLIGFLTLGLSILALLKIPRQPGPLTASAGKPNPPPPNSGTARSDSLNILTSIQFWISAVIFLGGYGTLVTLQGLWLTPFLMTGLEIERVPASNLNMLIPIGVIIGSPLIGWLSDRLRMDKHHLLVAILSVYTFTWIMLIFCFKWLGTIGLVPLLLIMGIMGGGFISIGWAIVRESTPARLMGLTSGLINPAPILGVAIFQLLTGAILDHSVRVSDTYSTAGFQNAFLSCLIANCVCLGLAVIWCNYRGVYGEPQGATPQESPPDAGGK
jgi:MFS family permease